MTWSALATVPSTSSLANFGVLNGKLHIVGGSMGSIQRIYDPELDAWSTGASPNTLLSNFLGAVHNNLLYASYGFNSVVRIYNPDTNTWQNGNNAPTAQNQGWMVSNGTNLYRGGTSASIHVLDTTTAWTGTAVMTTNTHNRSQMMGTSLHGEIYLAGGNASGSDSSTFLRYEPPNTMVELTSLPIAVSQGLLFAADPWIYLLCGQTAAGASDAFYRYDIELDTWTQLEDYPIGVIAPSGGVIDGRVYVFGGTDGWDATDVGYSIEVGHKLLASTMESSSALAPYPYLVADLEGAATVSVDIEEGILETLTPHIKSVRSSSLIKVMATGEETFDVPFPGDDVYPSEDLYPNSDW